MRKVLSEILKLCVLLLGISMILTLPTWASSANFEFRGQNIELSEVTWGYYDQENEKMIWPKINAKIKVNQPFTMIAQGMTYPKSPNPKSSHCKPDEGVWLFNDEVFELQILDRTNLKENEIGIRLKALSPGETRIRFIGIVLNYRRTFDIIVQVTE